MVVEMCGSKVLVFCRVASLHTSRRSCYLNHNMEYMSRKNKPLFRREPNRQGLTKSLKDMSLPRRLDLLEGRLSDSSAPGARPLPDNA